MRSGTPPSARRSTVISGPIHADVELGENDRLDADDRNRSPPSRPIDMALAIDTYIAAYLETMTRHQAAIRELSTPVIKVHDRILLLPIVGTVDTQRAHQIMETVLLQVVEQQAKVMILDIAGVPVVDTKVADHILKTTAAVQLLRPSRTSPAARSIASSLAATARWANR